MTFALKIKSQLCKFTAVFAAAVMIVTLLVSQNCNYRKTVSADFTDAQQYYIDQVAALVNIERQAQGLEPLSVYPLLCEAAIERSVEIVELFDHQRPDGTICYTVLEDYSIEFWEFGENIAMGYTTPEAVVQGWMDSPNHRANILGENFTHIGIGYYKSGNVAYWTQLFIKTKSDVSDAYIPGADASATTTTPMTTTTASAAVTTTTTTKITTTTTATAPKVTTTTTTSVTTTPTAISTTTTTTSTTSVTTTTLYAPPTISVDVELGDIQDMYFADNTKSLLEGSTFEIIVKKPISQFVYSEYHFNLSSVISLENVDSATDSTPGISPCDIYYSAKQSGEYSINYRIEGMAPSELAKLISETVGIDLSIIQEAMTGKIVDDSFNYLDSVFGTFDAMIALRGDVDLNGICDSNDAEIIADYESKYSDALAESFLLKTEFEAPILYENGSDSDSIKALRAFAANVNSDTDANGSLRIDNLDAAYIQMFATEYQAVCDGLEASGQQLDIIQTTISLWENCGILQ
ncbi:MAG: hypothetical protein IJO29_03210 [Oscillospiraceae bacterium]|nr:hypothetical protein [Oscillospiraceae bacterium]